MLRVIAFVLAVLGSSRLYSQPMVIIQSVKSDRPQPSQSFVKRHGLDRQDVQSIPEFVQGIQMVQPSANRVVSVRRSNPQTLDTQREAAMVMAVPPAHRIRQNLRIVQGSEFEDDDYSLATSRCLISADFATRWFGSQQAVGQYLLIEGNARLLVAGVFEFETKPNTRLTSPEIVIPITTYDQRFSSLIIDRREGSFSASEVQYSEFQIDTADGSDLNDVADNVRVYLSRRYPDREFRVITLRLKESQ